MQRGNNLTINKDHMNESKIIDYIIKSVEKKGNYCKGLHLK